jgi:hypothetical protein
MSPDDPMADLVERTLSNLRTIDDLALEHTRTVKPFEVTQMLNSLLSLLVVPRELGTVECIGRSSVPPHVHADGIRDWRDGPVEFELRELRGKRPQHLKKLLVGLRNSVAHANFKFQPESGGEISSLVFTTCSRDGTAQWSATFRVSELRRFLVNLGAELIAAREYQLSHPIRDAAAEAETIELEINLPSSFVQRINRLVAAGEVRSVSEFIRDAVEAQLRDDEDASAA